MLTAPEPMCTCSAYGGKSYFFCPGPKDWTAARTLCMGATLDLVAIESMAEQMFVGMNVSANSWLGANNVGPNSWVWTATGKEFFNMAEVGGAFVNWAPGSPTPAPGLCALMQGATDDWVALSCITPSGYVCEQK